MQKYNDDDFIWTEKNAKWSAVAFNITLQLKTRWKGTERFAIYFHSFFIFSSAASNAAWLESPEKLDTKGVSLPMTVEDVFTTLDRKSGVKIQTFYKN